VPPLQFSHVPVWYKRPHFGQGLGNALGIYEWPSVRVLHQSAAVV
jgi:hypothetical protein